jgi:hypothetical protein
LPAKRFLSTRRGREPKTLPYRIFSSEHKPRCSILP